MDQAKKAALERMAKKAVASAKKGKSNKAVPGQKGKAGHTVAKGSGIPNGWFLMVRTPLTVTEIRDILKDSYETEIWTEAGIAEIVIGEKASIDLEPLELDLGDDYSNAFLKENGVQTLYDLSFPREAFDLAKPVLKQLSAGIDGFICGDTEDFTPRF